MTVFYKIYGYDSSGNDIRGDIVSISMLSGESVNAYLQSKNIQPTQTPKFLLRETLSYNLKMILGTNTSSVSDQELFDFLTALKESLETEMSLIEQYEYLKELFDTNKMKNLVISIQNNVTINGTPLHLALKEAGFPLYVVSSIEVGTESGNIGPVLTKLLSLVNTKIQTSKSIKKMLREPKITGVFLITYFYFSIFYFIPNSKELLKYSDPTKWPPLTTHLLNWSDFALENKVVFVLISLGSIFISIFLLVILLKLLAKIFPPIKRINQMQEISLIFSVLTVAAYSNILIQDALRQAVNIIKNPLTRKKLDEISNGIENGDRFSNLLELKGFEKKLILEVKAGEATANFSRSFEKISNKYKEKVEDSIDIAMGFIRPVTLIFATAVVLILYYGINAPLLNFGTITGQ